MFNKATLAFAFGCLLLFGVGFYAVAYATGSITIVGYEAGGRTQWGFFGQGTSFDLKVPVWLNEGNALQADYVVDARAGSLLLKVRKSIRTPVAYSQIGGQQSGRMLFVAQTSGFHRYGSDPTSLGSSTCLGKRTALDFMLPDADCPTYDVDYSIAWRVVGRQEVSAWRKERVLIPREGETFSWQHVKR